MKRQTGGSSAEPGEVVEFSRPELALKQCSVAMTQATPFQDSSDGKHVGASRALGRKLRARNPSGAATHDHSETAIT